MAVSSSVIILSADPKGHFMEGTLASGQTPKPGTLMTRVTDANTWQAYTAGADGHPEERVVLLEDSLRGVDVDTAYGDGAHCYLYAPLPGDELRVLYKNVTGTADDVDFGDLLIADDTTGKLIVTTGSPENEWFKALEAIVDPTADQLLHVVTLP